MLSVTESAGQGPKRAPLLSARRDALVLAVLIAAVILLIWNGSTLFQQLSFAGRFGDELQVAGTALTLNVALILFGWRRYVDLQHESELRADGERRAAILASTDPLTGLLNRKGFSESSTAMCQAAATSDQLVILSLQIHRFKVMNDRHGYEVGDALLKCVADAIRGAVGDESQVARLSGDEFAVAMVLPADRVRDAEAAAEAVLRSTTRPFTVGDRLVQVGAFAGIASAPAPGVRIPDLLRRADIAMDHAKTARSARPVWFDSAMERALLAHSEIEQGIRHGLDHGQFVPFFEPQIELSTGRITGFEMLARWHHPLSGMIGPDTFIPVAEEIGEIGRLSEQVIGQALAEAAAWDPSIKISVNISPRQLTDAWLAQRIVRLLTETAFPAERLVVEITESSLFADIDLARSIVTSLKNQGIRLALDDFGTGFSSLAHLRSLPFDMIKIDRTFVANIHSNRESMAIVRAVTTLATALGVPVCVEGIEDEETRATVARLGCEIGQGWYFGKPMSAEQALQMLQGQERADASSTPRAARA